MADNNTTNTQDQASSGSGQDQASNSNDQASNESSQSQNQNSQQNNNSGQLTAADYDRILKELRSENAKFRTELKGFKDSQTTAEEEKLRNEKKFEELAAKKEKEANELRQQLAQRDRAILVSKIVAKHKLPEDLADMLTGETEVDLEANAVKLAKHIKPPTAANTEGGAGNNRQAGAGNTNQAGQGQGQEVKKPYTFQQPGEVAW